MSFEDRTGNEPELKMSRAGKPATRVVQVLDSRGQHQQVSLAEERALTVFLDKRELVTLMTLGDDPEHLVLGWLLNQRLIDTPESLAAIQVDWTVGAAAVTSRLLQDREAPSGNQPRAPLFRPRPVNASSPPVAVRARCMQSCYIACRL